MKYLLADCTTAQCCHAACNNVNSTSCPKLLRFWHTFAKFFVSSFQVGHVWAAIWISWHAVSEQQKKPPWDGDISTFLCMRPKAQVSPPSSSSSSPAFFMVSSSTPCDWEATLPPLAPRPSLMSLFVRVTKPCKPWWPVWSEQRVC